VNSHTTITKPRKSPTVRSIPELPSESSSEEAEESLVELDAKMTVGTQVSDGLEKVIEELKGTIMQVRADLTALKLCIENILKDDQLVTFYTGFPSYITLKSCYDYLGPAVNSLIYWGSKDKDAGHGRSQTLSSFNGFFLVLVQLRLGLFERDLANHFNISVSTVCHICRTWICFMYLRFKEIPLWPS